MTWFSLDAFAFSLNDNLCIHLNCLGYVYYTSYSYWVEDQSTTMNKVYIIVHRQLRRRDVDQKKEDSSTKIF